MTSHSVHVLLPNDIDDPAAPSGGNIYDRRICQGLAVQGFSVHEQAARGTWPQPSPSDRSDFSGVLGKVPDGSVTLVDGLIASAVPDLLQPHARRLRLVVLMHMPLANTLEGQALSSAVAIVTTSRWARGRLLELYGLPAERVHAAPPGVDEASVAPGSPGGSRLLCVAAVAPNKGHDILVEALASLGSHPFWNCVCVGSLDRDPSFVELVRRRAAQAGIAGRLRFCGARTGADLEAAYAEADLLVLPSRGETYGMVVTEALARGIPVLASDVSGVHEALGRAPGGALPGILVPRKIAQFAWQSR
ncbi:MAG TPA: glycosyltransferase family 4 protein, partial [Candidatus Limnocylindrales bacterium]